MQMATAQPRQFTGKHMLAILISFFGVVIAVNVALAYLANSTWSGLVVANGYDASQSFNADQRRTRIQQAEGWTMKLSHQDGAVTLVFADKAAQPLRGLTIVSAVGRPTTDSQDQKLSFRETAPGTYAAPVKLASGIWDVNVEVTGDGEQNYRKTYEIIVK
jgi:nitrogen fixation protein FixH